MGVIVESTANGTNATGWQIWPASTDAHWCWSASVGAWSESVGGVFQSGTASTRALAEEMATQAYARLQDDQRRRALRSI